MQLRLDRGLLAAVIALASTSSAAFTRRAQAGNRPGCQVPRENG